jgi:hypothetical protein
VGALGQEKIRCIVIGMSAASIQGVPGSTVDVELWLDRPPRQYMRAINGAVREGAEFVRNTVVALADSTLVNFVYGVTGLPSFKRIWPRVRFMRWQGVEVAVLPLKLIKKSKEAIRWPKDLIHVELIRQRLAVIKRSKVRKKGAK